MYVMERVTITQFHVMEAVKAWISSCASLEINVTVIGIIAIMKNIVMMALMRVGPVKPGMCKPVKCVLQMCGPQICGNYMCTDCVIFQMLCLLQIYLLPTFKSYVGLYFELYIFFSSLKNSCFVRSILWCSRKGYWNITQSLKTFMYIVCL